MTGKNKITIEFPERQPEKRLRELILYLADLSQGDPTFGKVKLAKLLYFADFTSYRLYGVPITGAKYIKMERGPVPAAFLDLLDEMKSTGQIDIRQEPYYNYDQHRVIARQQPDLTIFTGRDIALIDRFVRDFWGKTAKEISELSHDMGWRVANLKEPIPYQASLLSDEGVTREDIDHAQKLNEKYGLNP
jgi:hypothetical protein